MNNLRGELLGIEMELSVIEADITEVEHQLMYLEAMQNDLIYNLELLRRPEIVAAINAYNQSIVQLKEVQSRILHYRSLRLKLNGKMDKYEKMQYQAYDDLESIYSQLEKEKTILIFRKRE